MSLYTFDKVTFVGKVGRDAEMKFMPNGDPITSFSVACDRSYKSNGELMKRTIWYRVSVFGKFAEVCKNIKKGEVVFVEGELQADWTSGTPKVYSKSDGTPAANFDVTAQTVRFVGGKKESQPAEQQEEKEFPF